MKTKRSIRLTTSLKRGQVYLKAVEAGDAETAQRMVNEAATSLGFSTEAWHGTAIYKTGFRREGGAAGVGAYFTSSKEIANDYAKRDAEIDGDTPITMRMRLLLKNSLLVDGGEESQGISEKRRDDLEKRGYDSVVATYPDGVKEIIVFDPSQIKSADPITRDDKGNVIPLSQRFNSESNDIRT